MARCWTSRIPGPRSRPHARGREGRLHGDRRVLAGDPRVPSPGVSHATVAWVAASKAGHKVRALDVTGAYWNDVGDPATYARGSWMRSGARRDDLPLAGRSLRPGGDRRLRRPGVRAARSVTDRDSELHSSSRAGSRRVATRTGSSGRTTRSRCPNRTCSRPPRRREEAGPAERSALRAALRGSRRDRGPAPGSPIWSDAILIGLGGSDRRYFRLQHDGRRRC